MHFIDAVMYAISEMNGALTKLQTFSVRFMEVLCYPQYLTIKSLLYFFKRRVGRSLIVQTFKATDESKK